MSIVILLQQVTSIINLEHSSWTKETPLLDWCCTGRAHGGVTVWLVLPGNASQLQVKSESDFKFLCTEDPTKAPTITDQCWRSFPDVLTLKQELFLYGLRTEFNKVGGSTWIDEIPGNQKKFLFLQRMTSAYAGRMFGDHQRITVTRVTTVMCQNNSFLVEV